MLRRVLFVGDGSFPPGEAAALARCLLPNAAEISILQVVPQFPYGWIAWPAFPDIGQELANAWAYVSEVAEQLHADGWNVSTRVEVSPLSGAEMDQEILRLAGALRPQLIFLALAKGPVRAGVVRQAPVPVLAVKSSSREDDTEGLREHRRQSFEPSLVYRKLLLNPAAAVLFVHAGLL